tara:strand:+ start:1509 stop:2138 length:630 start_codon:yes stop_codon:yes gene_type:complete
MNGAIHYKDFIGIYENVYPDGFCRHVIEEFERLSNEGVTGNRQLSEQCDKTQKQDEFVFLNFKNQAGTPFKVEENSRDYDPVQWGVKGLFFEGLQRCFNQYCNHYDALKQLKIRCNNIKVQKTKPGEGYHVWHCEQGADDGERRIVTYALYLNTIVEAGETEYLYQKMRIPPRENTVVLWPASYTHPHRGNVVYGEEAKYIVTGWFYLE